MTATLTLLRTSPLTTIQDEGRFGMLRHGISASGPMDRGAFDLAGLMVEACRGAVEFSTAGIEIGVSAGKCRIGFAGGDFVVRHNGQTLQWPGEVSMGEGDVLSVTPGRWGNYGYLRFDTDLSISEVMGSIATNSRAALGGLAGRVLQGGDQLVLSGERSLAVRTTREMPAIEGPIRFIWGLHADLFAASIRQRFVESAFAVSSQLDRMGVRLSDPTGVFSDATILSLASDAIVPGDIQIMGDGTPIVLMRDHQPTGGYPRIATVITADLDRFAQLRPGSAVRFAPVTLQRAHQLLGGRTR